VTLRFVVMMTNIVTVYAPAPVFVALEMHVYRNAQR